MRITSYGDTINDGAVQLSFTLPMENDDIAMEAAKIFVLKHGFESCEIVHSESLSDGFTYFLAYGKTDKYIELDNITVEKLPTQDSMEYDEINEYIEKYIGRKLVIAGACTGTDAHTVCLDAIMNMKGYNHHFGLERYTMIETHNLGAQVPNEELIEFADKVNADAILISQVVTQKDIHIKNMTNFIEILNKEKLRNKFIVVVGGPKINHKLATEIGFDAGFGRGTYAEHVATFIAKQVLQDKQFT